MSLFVLVALLSFVWTPYDPKKINVVDRLLPPFRQGYLFGTDKLGRDVVTQLMMGARNSLYVSVMSTTIALTIGALFGLLVAGSGPRWHGALTRTADVGLALPGILVALVLATKFGPGNNTAIMAIIVWFVPVAARVTIGPARQILALDYVEAAFAYGRSKRLRPVQPRAAQHRPAADRAGVGDVRRRHPDRGVVGVPRGRRATADGVVGTVPAAKPSRSSTRPRT